jgi:UDP-N-acetylglucosamine--N-acetylmuramyl-(pentapeptide) pyrophosphoryl-undecaprenol N-acetylglucosamine transferase
MASESELRVVIAGGGTGGHLYPGIAVARAILARSADAKISFAGTARGIESRVIPREGFPLDVIRSAGLKGKAFADRMRGLALLPQSALDAWALLSRRRPHVVIGVGGYSSGPVVLAAALRGIPTLVHEQNAVPGFTNRWLAPFVRSAAVTFESTAHFFGAKAFVSGNPVREEFFKQAHEVQGGRGVHDIKGELDDASGVGVLVFGGSQGSHAINVAMVEAAPELAAGRPRLRLTHQTGEGDVEMVRDGYRRAGLPADVEPFIYDMGKRLGQADLVVCRAGMTTIAELEAAGTPAILVPLPTATDDHQRKNAEAVVGAGAADMLLQSAMSGRELARRILALAGDADRRGRMSAAARSLARPAAAGVIADQVLALANRAPGDRAPEHGDAR